MSQQNQLNDIGKLKRNFSILFEKMENIPSQSHRMYQHCYIVYIYN